MTVYKLDFGINFVIYSNDVTKNYVLINNFRKCTKLN